MENNNKQRALQLHLSKTLEVTDCADYTVKQSEYDDSLFYVELVDDSKEYLVLTIDEAEDRQDENLKDYIEERLNEIYAEAEAVSNATNIKFLIEYFDYEMWIHSAKIEETTAINFDAVGGEEHYSTIKDKSGEYISYNIYELEI